MRAPSPFGRSGIARATARVVAVVGLIVALRIAMPQARADALPHRKTGLARVGNLLTIDVGLPDLLTAEERQRLTSGFATRVFVRIYLHKQGNPTPVAAAFLRTEIVYDIWDERFRLRMSRGTGTEREIEVKTLEEAIAETTSLKRFPVADVRDLPKGEKYFLAIRGDLNPLSHELLAEVRRWLRQPSGPQRRPGMGGGDSFFGTFVTVFINPPVDDSEHQIRFVSQPFELPTP